MAGARADPQLGARQKRDRAPGNVNILTIALAGDPQHGNLDLVQLGRERLRVPRREMSQLIGELAAVVVVALFALDDVPAQYRLRVPVAHQLIPRIGLESTRPRFVARAAFVAPLFEIESRGDDDEAIELRAIDHDSQDDA